MIHNLKIIVIGNSWQYEGMLKIYNCNYSWQCILQFDDVQSQINCGWYMPTLNNYYKLLSTNNCNLLYKMYNFIYNGSISIITNCFSFFSWIIYKSVDRFETNSSSNYFIETTSDCWLDAIYTITMNRKITCITLHRQHFVLMYTQRLFKVPLTFIFIR